MAIGSYEYIIEKNKVKTYIFGVDDYHSHLRIRPIVDYAKSGGFDNKNVFEIGCGRGLNAYEIYFNSNCFRKGNVYYGCDLDCDSIKRANKIKRILKTNNMYFWCEDAKETIHNININNIDVVMMIDVLEHIGSDIRFLEELNSLIRKDAIYVISVPTKSYPDVFGWRFHNSIGHVRRGYTISELTNLMETIDKKLLFSSYACNTFGAIGAKIYYNISPKLGLSRPIRDCLSAPFLLESKNSKKGTTLFAVFG